MNYVFSTKGSDQIQEQLDKFYDEYGNPSSERVSKIGRGTYLIGKNKDMFRYKRLPKDLKSYCDITEGTGAQWYAVIGKTPKACLGCVSKAFFNFEYENIVVDLALVMVKLEASKMNIRPNAPGNLSQDGKYFITPVVVPIGDARNKRPWINALKTKDEETMVNFYNSFLPGKDYFDDKHPPLLFFADPIALAIYSIWGDPGDPNLPIDSKKNIKLAAEQLANESLNLFSTVKRDFNWIKFFSDLIDKSMEDMMSYYNNKKSLDSNEREVLNTIKNLRDVYNRKARYAYKVESKPEQFVREGYETALNEAEQKLLNGDYKAIIPGVSANKFRKTCAECLNIQPKDSFALAIYNNGTRQKTAKENAVEKAQIDGSVEERADEVEEVELEISTTGGNTKSLEGSLSILNKQAQNLALVTEASKVEDTKGLEKVEGLEGEGAEVELLLTEDNATKIQRQQNPPSLGTSQNIVATIDGFKQDERINLDTSPKAVAEEIVARV